MIIKEPAADLRSLRQEEIHADLVIAGGGLAGTCAAISAAREGLKVVLVQDRPVLGGNASSEVRLWVLGATSHMGNNNRWAREGGVINEIMEENLYRNRQGNPLILDTILLEKCVEEKNLTLLLNTAVYDIEKSDPDTLSAAIAFCPQNSIRYVLRAPLFCDASGDGILGFLSGAAFRMGAESQAEFGEGFAAAGTEGELLGHSIYFYSKDTGKPVKYVAPSWALKDITKIPRFRQFRTNMQGCNFWWIEYGGLLDTIHQTEDIKWELWKIVYGVWDYFKNSGNFPEAENLTLEWVGHVPGKRESRRFEGDHILTQQDVVEQRLFNDVVAHGGWALDLHPPEGIYSEQEGCTQWHAKGVFGIPFRCYYSRNVRNLFLAGRIISASHVAFGSTRVMCTCGAGGQAVGVAAALCKENNLLPRDVSSGPMLEALQTRLDGLGQFLPGISTRDPEDLAANARADASSRLQLGALAPAKDTWTTLDSAWAMLLPLPAGPCPHFRFAAEAGAATTVRAELWKSAKPGNFTPDVMLESVDLPLPAGQAPLDVRFNAAIPAESYHFIKLQTDGPVRLRASEERVTGVLAVTNAFNKQVAVSSVQSPPDGIGIDTFEFWLPKRRPEGRNLAITIEPPLDVFIPANVLCPARPTTSVNAWVAAPDDPEPTLTLAWPETVNIRRMVLEFDPDWDHPMESVLMTHPEEVVPFTIKDFDILDAEGKILAEIRDHHGARRTVVLPEAVKTSALSLKVLATHGAPAAIFRWRVFAR